MIVQPAEVRTLLHAAEGAQRVLEVGVHLDLLTESRSLDFNEGCGHSLHVGVTVVEGDSAGPDGVLVLVSVQACVDHTAEEVLQSGVSQINMEMQW